LNPKTGGRSSKATYTAENYERHQMSKIRDYLCCDGHKLEQLQI